MSSSGWHGLVTQSSAPSRSPRTRWATVDWPVQTTTGSAGSSRRDLLEIRPRVRAEQREIDDERAEAHRDEALDRHGTGQHDVLPAEAVEALAEYLDESCVAVTYGDAQRRCDDGGRSVMSGEV